MCGIIGNFNKYQKISPSLIDNLFKLSSEMKCRGPDFFDHYLDNSKKNFLGHLRLSIIDTSTNANQPLFSKNKRYVLSFNGEIYNYRELFKNLKNNDIDVIKSDSRVLLEHIAEHGFESTLKIINGMFALAVYDTKEEILYLARDFFGKKPIYYYFSENFIFFSSTLKPIILNDNIKKKIDHFSLEHFFNYGYCPSKNSIFNNIYKVEKNSYIKLNLKNWRIEHNKIHKNKSKPNLETKNFNSDKLEKLILESVERRLVSDVPICILQSSGIDSTLVSYFSSQINNKIDTYTVGFKDKQYDESIESEKISKFLGLKNNKIYLDDENVDEIIQNIPDAFDEPFADSSQIPTMLIFQKISKYAKVCVTGDGGDEIFYGYNRYQWFLIWKNLFKNNILNNDKTKTILTRIITNLEKNSYGSKLLNKFSLTSNKTLKFLNIFFQKENIYDSFIKLSFEKNILNSNQILKQNTLEKIKDLRDFDINNYLVNDILTKVDRSSMFYSVEARSPLLDLNIYNYMENFPYQNNINMFAKKKILKELLKKKIPSKIISKTKKGFAVPIENILTIKLREDLIDNINYYLKDERLKMLNSNVITDLMDRFFIYNDKKLCYQIWSFYVFFKWFKKYEKFITY